MKALFRNSSCLMFQSTSSGVPEWLDAGIQLQNELFSSVHSKSQDCSLTIKLTHLIHHHPRLLIFVTMKSPVKHFRALADTLTGLHTGDPMVRKSARKSNRPPQIRIVPASDFQRSPSRLESCLTASLHPSRGS